MKTILMENIKPSIEMARDKFVEDHLEDLLENKIELKRDGAGWTVNLHDIYCEALAEKHVVNCLLQVSGFDSKRVQALDKEVRRIAIESLEEYFNDAQA